MGSTTFGRRSKKPHEFRHGYSNHLQTHILRASVVRRIGDAGWQAGPGYDAKVIGVHHRRKKETPSGTSGEIARRIQAGRGDESPPEIVSLLAGGAISNHEIIFGSHNDEIRISHNVTRPDIDQTVLRTACQWLMAKAPGFYGLHEVLADAEAL